MSFVEKALKVIGIVVEDSALLKIDTHIEQGCMVLGVLHFKEGTPVSLMHEMAQELVARVARLANNEKWDIRILCSAHPEGLPWSAIEITVDPSIQGLLNKANAAIQTAIAEGVPHISK